MSEIRTVRLVIPGQWRDAWLYKEHLLLWDREGHAYQASLKELSRIVANNLPPEAAFLVDHLVFRNDWKSSEPFHRLIAMRPVLRALTGHYSESEHELSLVLPDINFRPAQVVPVPGVSLDTQVYANRVYSASTEGLYEWYFYPGTPEQESPMLQRLDFRISNVRAKYSSVNASAEQHGLWFQRIDFEEEWSPHGRSTRMARVSDESLGASFASWHLLNYTEEPVPRFLRAHVERYRPHDRAIYESTNVEEYEPERSIGDITLAALAEPSSQANGSLHRSPTSDTDLIVLGNSNYRLLVHWQERLHVVNVSAYDRRPIAARRNRQFRNAADTRIAPSEVLATYPIGGDFLVELFDKLVILTPAGSHTLFEGAAGRVRTFPDSRRHREAVAVAGEGEMNLVGFLEISHDRGEP